MSLRPIKNPQTPVWKAALKKVVQPLRSVGGCLFFLAVVATPIILPQIVFYYVFDLDDAPSHETVSASAATLPESASSRATVGQYHRERASREGDEDAEDIPKTESHSKSGLPITKDECNAIVRDTIAQAGHPEQYSPQLPQPPTRSVEDIASSFMEQYASAAKNIQQYSEAQSRINCAPIGEWSMAPSRPSAAVNPTVSFVPKRPTSQTAWQSDKSSDEEYWITEEDDETHNHTCSRYGEGDGTYSTEGSGNDCSECGGADYTSSSSLVSPTRTANTPTQTPTREYNATRYWVTSSSGKTHNASCRWYANSNGYYSSTGTGNNCKICGGAQ